MTARIRLGMVGGGEGAFIGGVHRMAARLDDRYLLVAAAPSSDPQRAHASGAAMHLDPQRVYADYREMARSEAARADGIEVVAIVTPNHLHRDVACAFLDAGIHVLCDKPLTRDLAEADELVARARASKLLFGVTYTYSGYPMVREARALVSAGALGEVRVVQVEYAQDWLAGPLETSGQKQAAWRTDPGRAGEGGCVGDIGTHAYHLAGFVTGLQATELSAELTHFVPGRAVDDDAQVRLRYANGARGLLWASQVATGCSNALTLRVFGSEGGLAWRQESPETLTVTRRGEPPRTLRRGGAGVGEASIHATRVPGGHPEGYLEAFAQLYRDMADQLQAQRDRHAPPPLSLQLPDVVDGARGMLFVDAALRSSRSNAAWVTLDDARWG
jgi:predicted dehydrogenase